MDKTTTPNALGMSYLMQGLQSMNGAEDTLQDFTAARESFEQAIDLGCVEAYKFLAYLYITGSGVRQSGETALELLKHGGELGDAGCFKTMWDIYAGNTVLDLRHDRNAELCFKWFLEASKGNIQCLDINDYLDHSYKILGGDMTTWGELRFPISRFPGAFVSSLLDRWIEQIQQGLRQMRAARLAGLSLEQAESKRDPAAPNFFEIGSFKCFISDCVKDGNDLIKRAMAGLEKEDLEYLFSRAENPRGSVIEFIQYI